MVYRCPKLTTQSDYNLRLALPLFCVLLFWHAVCPAGTGKVQEKNAAIESLAINRSAWRENLLDVFSTILKRVEKAEEIEGRDSDEMGECPELVADLIPNILFLDEEKDDEEEDKTGSQSGVLGELLEPWLDSPSMIVREEVAGSIGLLLDAEASFLPKLIDMARSDSEHAVRQAARNALRCAHLLPEDLQPSLLRRFFKSLPIIGWFINE